jgi:hypothetical protein
MRFSKLLTLCIVVLISGCLANVRGEAIAQQLNNQAENEGSPYRWVVVNSESEGVLLKQQIIGKAGETSANKLQQDSIKSMVSDAESKDGRSSKPILIEVRPISWFDAPMNYSLTGKNLEVWVFNNKGKTVVYKVGVYKGEDSNKVDVSKPWIGIQE